MLWEELLIIISVSCRFDPVVQETVRLLDKAGRYISTGKPSLHWVFLSLFRWSVDTSLYLKGFSPTGTGDSDLFVGDPVEDSVDVCSPLHLLRDGMGGAQTVQQHHLMKDIGQEALLLLKTQKHQPWPALQTVPDGRSVNMKPLVLLTSTNEGRGKADEFGPNKEPEGQLWILAIRAQDSI